MDQYQLGENELLVEQIEMMMRSDFIINLMDCAFEYRSWTVEEDVDENWEV